METAGLADPRSALRMNPTTTLPPTPRIRILGCLVDNLTMSETLERIQQLIESRQPHQHVVVNVDKVVKAQKSAELMRIINECSLINVDGMPVVWASRVLGVPLKERVAGIDLFESIMKQSASRGWRVFLLGAKEDVVQAVRAKYEAECPGIQIVGCRNGYWSEAEEPDVAGMVAAARPDILFVAMSSPKKEFFLGRYQRDMRVPFAMGVGGSFDVVSGKVKRAPVWMQRVGLEWFYRFLQEPTRMFRRYFIEDMGFFWLLAKEVLTGRKRTERIR